MLCCSNSVSSHLLKHKLVPDARNSECLVQQPCCMTVQTPLKLTAVPVSSNYMCCRSKGSIDRLKSSTLVPDNATRCSPTLPHLLNASESGSSNQQHSMLIALLTGPMQTYRVFSSCRLPSNIYTSRELPSCFDFNMAQTAVMKQHSGKVQRLRTMRRHV